METIVINGVTFNNFGRNNYSGGMELITAYPMPDNMVDDVLQGKYPGVFLNPSAPCTDNEFYGLLGSEAQYSKVYEKQKECQIADMIIDILGGFEELRTAPLEKFREVEVKVRKEYKDWWDISSTKD